MSSLLWINELEFCSGWQLEIQNHTTGKVGRNYSGHLIWPGAFHSEIILQGSVEGRSAAILSQWNLNTESLLTARKSSKELESEGSLSFSVHTKATPLSIHALTLLFLPDQLSYSVPLFCSSLLKANYLIQFTLYWRIDFFPAHPKQQIFGK